MNILKVPNDELDEDPGLCLYKGKKFTGIALAYDGVGNLVGETHFKNGLQNGIQLSLYEDGALEIISYSINYMICGPELKYSIDGSLNNEKWFFMGTPIPKPQKRPKKPITPTNSDIWNELEGFPVEKIDFSKEVHEINQFLDIHNKPIIIYS